MRAVFLSLLILGCGSSGGGGPDGSVPEDGGSSDAVAEQNADGGSVAMPTLLAMWPGPACCLSNDATSLYFLSSGYVYSVPIAGGMPTLLASPSYANLATTLPVKDTLYVMFWEGVLGEVPLPAGGLKPFEHIPQSGRGLVLLGTTLYWGGQNAINQIDVSGGMPTQTFMRPTNPIAITNDGMQLFWLEGSANASIVTATLPSGPPQVLGTASVLNPEGVMGVDSTSVYFLAGNNQGLMKIPRAGGTPTTIFGPNMGLKITEGISWFTVDGSTLWVSAAGKIYKLDSSGKGGVAINSSAGEMVTDANNLYWLGNQGIYKSPKP